MFLVARRVRLETAVIVNSIRLRTKSTHSSETNKNLYSLLGSMSKDRSHIVEAQKQRQRIKEKGSRYVPGTVTLQVLGCGAPGTPSSVFLFTDQDRYLFNCGEGTQRLAYEHKTKLARLEHIFLTRTCWSQLGGLPGLTLTVQDAGVPNLTLHGAPGLDEIFQGMRRFVVLKDLKVDSIDSSQGEIYEDNVITVRAIPIRKATSQASKSEEVLEIETDETDYYSHENGKNCENVKTHGVQKPRQEESVSISYICKLQPRPGALSLEKCVEKGVPPGPLLGQLKNGNDVTLEDGTVVKADEVRGVSDPGPVFMFIDIPSADYLPSFQENFPTFAKHQMTASEEEQIALVVTHFSPYEIVTTEIYQEFMSKFPPSTKHLMLNSKNNFSGYVATHRIQTQLNQLDDGIFPLLKEPQESDIITGYKKMKLESPTSSVPPSKTNDEQPYDLASTMTSYHLRPRKGLDRGMEPKLTPKDYVDETLAIEGFKEALENYKSSITKNQSTEEEYPQIVFLGTGSCIPNKTRNVSSILLHISRTSCILLDCGEGTWGQIVRFYGQSKALEVLKHLKGIYVSHLHADHHIGLIGLLKERQKHHFDALTLFAPRQITSWLDFYDFRIETIKDTYSLIPNGSMITTPLSDTKTTMDLGLKSIATCGVRHCPNSFGVALEFQNDKDETIKITYSGDTMPCRELVELGKNSTVLIHEATMEDELVAEAKLKMHSTVSQAINQGVEMNAKYTILTHFSQRYAKLPRIENTMNQNVAIAFDNMLVQLKDMNTLSKMYPVLKVMFTEHYEEMQQKAIKRALKKERKRLLSTEVNLTR